MLYLDPRWVLVMASAAIAYGFLSPVVAVRRLRFLSVAASHAALLAVALAIALSRTIGVLNEYSWAMLIGLGLMYLAGYMISRGVDPDTATSVFVALTASAGIVAVYYVLTRYSLGVDLWAIVVGDPLLVSWSDTVYAAAIAAVTALAVVLTYREQVCIGVERDCALITGVKVEVYDWLLYTLLALTAIAMVKIVGFVLEHIFILLPAAVAVETSRSAGKTLILSPLVSLVAALAGLALAVAWNQAPAGVAGFILLAMYVAAVAVRRR